MGGGDYRDLISALKYIKNLDAPGPNRIHVDIINISMSGDERQDDLDDILMDLAKNTILISAAGSS